MWPRLFPGMKFKGNCFVHEWLRCALHFPPLFSAWLYSGAEHLLLRQVASNQGHRPVSRKDKYELLLMQREVKLALKAFMNEIHSFIITDESVCVGFAPTRERSKRNCLNESGTLVQPAAVNTIQGYRELVGHFQSLRLLVQERGGVEKIQMPGLVEGLST